MEFLECIGGFKRGRRSVLEEARTGRLRLDHIDSKMLSSFTENELHSVRTLAHELGIYLSKVHDRLVNMLDKQG
jgi:hypothetical protein